MLSNLLSALLLAAQALTPPPTPVPIPSIANSIPPHQSIDARMPGQFSPITLNSPISWHDGNNPSLSDFGFSVQTPQATTPIAPSQTEVNGTSYKVLGLSMTPFPPKARLTIKHYPSNTEICLGFLPGDVNQSGTTNVQDITALINCLNQPGTCQPHQTDINRSGTTNVQDITALINLLNGAVGQTSWQNQALSNQCPETTMSTSFAYATFKVSRRVVQPITGQITWEPINFSSDLTANITLGDVLEFDASPSVGFNPPALWTWYENGDVVGNTEKITRTYSETGIKTIGVRIRFRKPGNTYTLTDSAMRTLVVN